MRRNKKRQTIKKTPGLKLEIQKAYQKGTSVKKIMAELNITQRTLYQGLKGTERRGGFVRDYIRPAIKPEPKAVSTSFSSFEDKINKMLKD